MSDSQKTEVFIDGITSMRLMAGVVRIDFGELSRPPMEGETPDFSNKLRMFLPLDGFLRSLGSMQGLAEKLKSEGVLKAKDANGSDQSDDGGKP
jgi:hypothetical protein